MLVRKIEKDIVSWIKNSDKGLIVCGVRQAGKTFVIRKCLTECGCDYVEFNLIDQPQIVTILESSTSVDDLMLRLALLCDKPIIPGKTFIFFDEIQLCKEIVTKVKFLVEDKRYRYILSGPLLGVAITNLLSAPVGYLQSLTVYPLDFEEFLQIFNVNEAVITLLKKSFENKTPVDEVIHQRLMHFFNMYLIIGGMPAAVEKYRTTGDINAVIDEHHSILKQYRLDFNRYEEENRKLVLNRIYDLIPAGLNEKNKRFFIAGIDKYLRYDRIRDSFAWLWKAGVALPVFNTTEPAVPLILNEKSTMFKLFLSDVGLLTTIYGKATKLEILNNGGDLHKGAVFENAVAQELAAHGFKLYYHTGRRLGELDFVIENGGNSLPVEVKSGKDYERHSALNNCLSFPAYNIGEAVVLAHCNVKVIGNITYYPIYMTMFITEKDVSFGDISVERFSF